MKRKILPAIALCILALAAWRLVSGALAAYRLPTASLAALGLQWQECPADLDSSIDSASQACFGRPAPRTGEDEKAKRAVWVNSQDLRLNTNSHIYETRLLRRLLMVEWHILLQDGFPVKSLFGRFYAHTPSISLKEINGKPAWEFADGTRATIIYDGKDLRQVYGLDAAYAPYELDGRLIFIGQRAEKYFVIYDGVRAEPEFDDIIIAYCCESSLYSAFGGQGRYRFYGARGDQRFLVEIQRTH